MLTKFWKYSFLIEELNINRIEKISSDNNMVEKKEEEIKIDTNLYSRQIGTFGIETMGKLIKMKVLIIGCRGLGVETAKNLILAGP